MRSHLWTGVAVLSRLLCVPLDKVRYLEETNLYLNSISFWGTGIRINHACICKVDACIKFLHMKKMSVYEENKGIKYVDLCVLIPFWCFDD